MSLRRLLWAMAALLAIAAVVWLGRAIEWVDDDVTRPAQGEAARDGFYAAKQLLRRLGARVETPQNFEAAPPPQAILVLTSARWNLFPGGAGALQRWVEAGGRLVVFQHAWSAATDVPAWVPIRSTGTSMKQDAGEAGEAPTLPTALARLMPSGPCSVFSEPEGFTAAYGMARSFRVCGFAVRRLAAAVPVQWQLADSNGSVTMRVALGRGSVTLHAVDGSFANEALLRDDGALVLAAVLQLRAGDLVWFVDEQGRRRFLAALWANGSPVLLLAALALTLALWRAGIRFGPPLREAGVARRSIGEQVRRTAAFIAGGGGGALQRAAVRALEDEARRTVPGYGALAVVSERAAAIARVTGSDAAALAAAMAAAVAGAAGSRSRAAATIALLEHVRRALRPRRGPPPSPSPRHFDRAP